MTRLVLVRHGESEWNVERRVQGQAGAGLTERGRRQAAITAELLAEAFPDAIVTSSDQPRSLETAAAFVERTAAEIQVDPDLRERHFGAWTGRLVSEIAAEDGDRWERWVGGEDVIAEVGGEDAAALAGRAEGALRRIAAGADGRPVVCFTHGGPIWHGVRSLLDLSPWVLGGVANCSLTEVEIDPADGDRLITWNQVGHLPLDLRGRLRAADADSHARRPPLGA